MTIDDAIRFIEAVYGPLPSSRLVDDYVREARARLAMTLPADLVRYYELTAGAHDLHHAHNQLVSPQQLDFASDRLVIYEENQGVVAWGIHRDHLREPNPPVEQGQPLGDTWDFYPEFDSLAAFACAQASWQAVQGALPFSGVLEDFGGKLPSGEPALRTRGMKAWLVRDGVCVEAGDCYLGLATRSAEAFIEASKGLDLAIDDWDWATLQELDDA